MDGRDPAMQFPVAGGPPILRSRVRILPFLPLIPLSNAISAGHVAVAGYLFTIPFRRVRPGPERWLVFIAVIGGLAVLLSHWIHDDAFYSIFLGYGFILIISLIGTALYTLDVWAAAERGWILTFGVTLTSAGLVFQLFSPSLEAGAMSNPWKFILGMPVGFAALALAGRRSGRRCVGRVLLVSGILTGISLVTGARSLALFFAMTALIVYTQDGRGRAARRIAVTLTCLLTVLVTTLIPVNDLPSSTVEKFQQQASVNPNPLLAGRTEVPLSLTVVSDHPLWGVGDTAQPYGGLVSKAEITARSMGYADPHALVPWWVLRNQIISHSVIFDMWIRWGVLGALPFLAAFLLIAWNTWKGRHAIRAADASLLFVTLLSAWDLLFSPAGSGRAAVIGYALAYALALRRLPSVHPAQREVMVKAATSRGTV